MKPATSYQFTSMLWWVEEARENKFVESALNVLKHPVHYQAKIDRLNTVEVSKYVMNELFLLLFWLGRFLFWMPRYYLQNI